MTDIKEVRIDQPLNRIGEAILVVLPEEHSWSLTEFSQQTKEHCETIALKLDCESRKVCVLATSTKTLQFKC